MYSMALECTWLSGFCRLPKKLSPSIFPLKIAFLPSRAVKNSLGIHFMDNYVLISWIPAFNRSWDKSHKCCACAQFLHKNEHPGNLFRQRFAYLFSNLLVEFWKCVIQLLYNKKRDRIVKFGPWRVNFNLIKRYFKRNVAYYIFI